MILVTGGAGFIGSNFVRHLIARTDEAVVNVDLLTYAGNLGNLADLADCERHIFAQFDIGDRSAIDDLLAKYRPRAVVNFAAESHVDRSINSAGEFIHTNIVGLFNLLEACRCFWQDLSDSGEGRFRQSFRFLQVSTDEVYGSLAPNEPAFSETTRYQPNSPYSASKAAGDHLVRAWHHTYGMPVLTTNCSNNYGPFQFPEKLIPLVLLNAVAGKSLPIYGDGLQVRDWLYVEDHCSAIARVLESGTPGEVYNVGGNSELPNIRVVQTLCDILDRLQPRPDGKSYREQITFVADRPGHDRRYAIDARKIERDLNWRPAFDFSTAIEQTVKWYLANPEWVSAVQSGAYREWIETRYGESA